MNIIDPQVTDYIEGYYVPLTPYLADLRQYAENRLIPIILKDTEMFILSLLKTLKPKNILEIGTAIGYSALVMATALPEANIVTVENDIRGVKKTRNMVSDLGISHRIKVIHGDGVKVLGQPYEKVLLDEGQSYDFVFIDGGKSHYQEFWQGALNLTKRGSIILCDNVLMKGIVVDPAYDQGNPYRTSSRKMRQFISHVMGYKGVNTSLLPIGDGVTLSYVE